jgi:hypothetical protein
MEKIQYSTITIDGDIFVFSPEETYLKRLCIYTSYMFSPFKRGAGFDWNYCQYNSNDENKTIRTSIAQLRFFQWVFKYDIMHHIMIFSELDRFYKNK